ncbi:MAG: hypothetical protein J5706_03175, partial [Elusimicrobiales bacterium]|nr:hypothetical protein [Elusimicrobiales bacterium]
MRMIKYFLLAILLVPQISFAETKYDCGKAYSSSSSATSRLKQYEYCINKEASPVQAKLLLEDKSALSATKNKYLKQQAVAIKDLYELLDQDWTEGKGNALNQSLVNRIGEGKVLSRSGLGPE